MNKSFSVYLDALRFFAALLVFFSHFAYARFTDGYYLFIRELNLGSDAVVFFFVLSGLVIAYTTDVKDKTGRLYAWHRTTRMYSVMILAVLCTILFDTIGAAAAPENYDGWWYNPTPGWLQALMGLSFANEWFGFGFRIGTNGPLWSLSYEVMYYLIFGAAFYLKGWRRLSLLALLLLIAGVKILLLFPAWLLGLGVYRLIRSGKLEMDRLSAVLCIIAPLVIYVVCLAAHLPYQLKMWTVINFGEEFYKSLRFSDEFIWNNLIALLIAAHLTGVYALTKHLECTAVKLPVLSGFIRWGAGASFTIYVIHYPALQMLDALLPETLETLTRHVALFSLGLALCFALAEISERRLKWFRGILSKS